MLKLDKTILLIIKKVWLYARLSLLQCLNYETNGLSNLPINKMMPVFSSRIT